MNKLIYTLLFSSIIAINTNALTWPTANVNVASSYGAYEHASPSHMHDGIDIDGVVNGVVKAVGEGDIFLVEQGSGATINIYLELTNGDYVEYGHVDQITSLPLYSGSAYNITTTYTNASSTSPSVHVNEGDPIAKIVDKNLAGTSHTHLHFNYLSLNATNQLKQVNPLDYLTPNDPASNSLSIGTYFFKHANTNTYLHNKLFSSVEIVNEITDNQGSIIFDPNSSNHYPADADAFGLPNTLLQGKEASPYSIEFSILDRSGTEVYPAITNNKCKIIFKNPSPNTYNSYPIPNFDKLFEQSKLVFYSGIPPDENYFNHCYKLTNIEPSIISISNPTGIIYSGSVPAPNRYWNTKLRNGVIWNGLSAMSPLEAKYPDGEYKVKVIAEDKDAKYPSDQQHIAS